MRAVQSPSSSPCQTQASLHKGGAISRPSPHPLAHVSKRSHPTPASAHSRRALPCHHARARRPRRRPPARPHRRRQRRWPPFGPQRRPERRRPGPRPERRQVQRLQLAPAGPPVDLHGEGHRQRRPLAARLPRARHLVRNEQGHLVAPRRPHLKHQLVVHLRPSHRRPPSPQGERFAATAALSSSALASAEPSWRERFGGRAACRVATRRVARVPCSKLEGLSLGAAGERGRTMSTRRAAPARCGRCSSEWMRTMALLTMSAAEPWQMVLIATRPSALLSCACVRVGRRRPRPHNRSAAVPSATAPTDSAKPAAQRRTLLMSEGSIQRLRPDSDATTGMAPRRCCSSTCLIMLRAHHARTHARKHRTLAAAPQTAHFLSRGQEALGFPPSGLACNKACLAGARAHHPSLLRLTRSSMP